MSSAVIGINGLDQGPRSKFAFGGRGGGLTSNALASTRGGLGKSYKLKQERSAEMAGNAFKTNMVW